MKEYVVPKNLDMSDRREATNRAIDWLGDVITVARSEIKNLNLVSKDHVTEETNTDLLDLYRLIDEIIKHLFFAVANERRRSEKAFEGIPQKLSREFYDEVKPLMKQVIDLALDDENGVMSARTASFCMRLVTSFREYNPKEDLNFAVGVAKLSERSSYSLDSLAVDDAVKFVETILAYYRREVREEQALEDLLNLLAILAKAGSSDALRLVWRLDEVFR